MKHDAKQEGTKPGSKRQLHPLFRSGDDSLVGGAMRTDCWGSCSFPANTVSSSANRHLLLPSEGQRTQDPEGAAGVWNLVLQDIFDPLTDCLLSVVATAGQVFFYLCGDGVMRVKV